MSHRFPLGGLVAAALMSGMVAVARAADDGGSGSPDPAAAALAAMEGNPPAPPAAGPSAEKTKTARAAKAAPSPESEVTGNVQSSEASIGSPVDWREAQIREKSLHLAVLNSAHKPKIISAANVLIDAEQFAAYLRGPSADVEA